MAASDTALPIARDAPTLRQHVGAWRGDMKTVAMVPTMGALHAGHMALVTQAQALADVVIVTIFVNPTQFGPNEDLDAYPRQEAADLALLKEAGVDLVYMPDAAVMYPDGFQTEVRVADVSQGLCGAHRPGHFDGVATVVSKLLLQGLPDLAVFGEKDFQQLAVIRQLAADLNIPVEIVGAPTVREGDGLALSSRNAYLAEAERAVAPVLYKELVAAAADIAAGAEPVARCDQVRTALMEAGFSHVDYVEARLAATLAAYDPEKGEGRLLVAATLGKTRLIDNVPIVAA